MDFADISNMTLLNLGLGASALLLVIWTMLSKEKDKTEIAEQVDEALEALYRDHVVASQLEYKELLSKLEKQGHLLAYCQHQSLERGLAIQVYSIEVEISRLMHDLRECDRVLMADELGDYAMSHRPSVPRYPVGIIAAMSGATFFTDQFGYVISGLLVAAFAYLHWAIGLHNHAKYVRGVEESWRKKREKRWNRLAYEGDWIEGRKIDEARKSALRCSEESRGAAVNGI